MKPLRAEQREHLVRPFMRWVGGKQRLVGQLLNYLPPEDTYSRYYELFLGAGSLFLARNFPNPVLNDLNFHLINTYQQVRSRPEAVHRLITEHARQLTRDHRRNFGGDWENYRGKRGRGSYYYTVRDAYNAHLELPDDIFDPERLRQAARFLFLIHSNYNGLFRVNQRGAYNVPFGKKLTHVPDLEQLNRISARLQNARLTNHSFEELEPEIGAGAFVYLDPPYPDLQPQDLFHQTNRSQKASFTAYNAPPFETPEHQQLAAFADRIRRRGAKVMVSIVEPFGVHKADPRRTMLREWYPEAHWCYHRTKFKRTLGPRKDPQLVHELILTSYETKKCRPGHKLKRNRRK
ncbi:MAG: Dam family site-specific DNA-(adenine-N6)-methyltransferase [Bacteroidota bacterium]